MRDHASPAFVSRMGASPDGTLVPFASAHNAEKSAHSGHCVILDNSYDFGQVAKSVDSRGERKLLPGAFRGL